MYDIKYILEVKEKQVTPLSSLEKGSVSSAEKSLHTLNTSAKNLSKSNSSKLSKSDSGISKNTNKDYGDVSNMIKKGDYKNAAKQTLKQKANKDD